MNTKAISHVKSACVLAIALVVAGCSGLGYQYPNQPAVAVNSQVQLNLSAQVPLDQDRIYIQNQMIVSKAQIDEQQVYCSVVMQRYQEAGKPQLRVEPGTFSVWRVRLYNDFVYQPTIYANNDDRPYSPSFGIDFRTEIHLKSSAQPNISALACTEHRLEYQHHNTYPERAQFEAVLGDLVTLP